MKKTVRILLSMLVILCMAFTAVACGNKDTGKTDNGGTPGGDNQGGGTVQTVEAKYYDVTVVNGTIKGKDYNHDKVKEGEKITVVASGHGATLAEDVFVGWNNGTEVVSTAEEYEITVNANTTLTAQYGYGWSEWDGEYPEWEEVTTADIEEDEDNRIVHIKSATGLAAWAAYVNPVKEETLLIRGAGYKYSTFDWGIYSNQASGYTDAQFAVAYNPENQWTFSLECNVDMAGEEWIPICDNAYALNDTIFEGNNHIIKNMKVSGIPGDGVAADDKNHANSNAAGGFFGEITGSNITMQNVTFDSAEAEFENASGNACIAVVMGMSFGNNRYPRDNTQIGKSVASSCIALGWDKWHTIKFDNVNVLNSRVAAASNSKGHALLIANFGYNADSFDRAIITNCTVADNVLVGNGQFGGLVGKVWTADQFVTDRAHVRLDFENNNVTGLTVISSMLVADSNADDTNLARDMWSYGATGAVFSPQAYSGTYINYQVTYGENAVTNIDLHTGGGTHTYGYLSMNKEDFENGYKNNNTNIFVTKDIDYTEQNGEITDPDSGWYKGGNENKNIILVNGATIKGLTYGDTNVYCLSGERDKDGYLIVTDLEGNKVGRWEAKATYENKQVCTGVTVNGLVKGTYAADGTFTAASTDAE